MEIRLDQHVETELPSISEHQPIELACMGDNGAWLELTVDGQILEPFLRPGDAMWRWRWNPGAAVGLHAVVLQKGESRQAWHVRVEPRKIDQERYEALLEDIQQVAAALVYELSGASAEGGILTRERSEAVNQLENYYALVEGQLPAFTRAVRRIAARPREQLASEHAITPLGQAAGVDAAALVRLAQGAFDEAPADVAAELQAAIRPEGGLLPRSVAQPRQRPTYDTYEHRLLKQVLNMLLRRVRFIGLLAVREAERLERADPRGTSGRAARVRQIVEGCQSAERSLRELRSQSFLDDVGMLPAFRGATPLLQREPAYREVYRMWQALRQQTALEWDSPLFAIPITELPYLYETWCALQLASALLRLGGNVREQRLVHEQPAKDEAERMRVVQLAENMPLLVVEREGVTLKLRYQPRYRPQRTGEMAKHLGSLDRHTRVPDLAIEIERSGDSPSVLIFDAKYRLDEDGRGVPQDALADAYAYLGAIGANGVRATRAAVLLYPGQNDERYPSGVGAIALVPGRTEGLEECVRKLLSAES